MSIEFKPRSVGLLQMPDYFFETFRVITAKEIHRRGEYCIARLVLQARDAMEKGA